MPENFSGLRRSSFRFVKWLGYDVVENNPLVRMLHESRAAASAREKVLPLKDRPSYQIRQSRIYSRGRSANDTAIAVPPAESAASEAPSADELVAPPGAPDLGAPAGQTPPTASAEPA